MKKYLVFLSVGIVFGLIILYFKFVYGWLEFRKNTDTPDRFINPTTISTGDFNKDRLSLINQFKDLAIKHVGFFSSKEYYEETDIIIDTILYSPKYEKLVILMIARNPTSRQLMAGKNEIWYYNATSYLGLRQNDSIALSWLGPNFSNSSDLPEISHILREACFRTFVSQDTIGEFAHKYNLNDVRFWTGKEWLDIVKEKNKRIEFEKEKREHPENIYEPK